MNRVKKFALLSFLLINVAVLALDYFQVKEFIRTLSDNNEYIAYLYCQLLFFPNHFYLKWSMLVFLGLAIGFGQKSRFDPTVFIKYTVADTVLFGVIAGVISAFEKENIIVFLNSVIMDIVIGGMLFLLCLTRDYRIQFLSARLCQKQNRCSDCFVPDADPTGLWLRQGDFSVSS